MRRFSLRAVVLGIVFMVQPFSATALVATNYEDCADFSAIGAGSVALQVPNGTYQCAFNITGTAGDGIGVSQLFSVGPVTDDVWVSGEWVYSTNDSSSSSNDVFGYFIDQTFTQLSTNGLTPIATHFGDLGFKVLAGQVFGWYTNTTAASLGASSISVYANFEVPLPAGGVLLLSALGGLGLVRRRRSQVTAIA